MPFFLSLHQGDGEERLLLLSFITWLLLGTAVYALIVQMKSVFRQRHDLQKQQAGLLYVGRNETSRQSDEELDNHRKLARDRGTKHNVLFERTNATLAHAKAEIRQGSTGRPYFS